MSEDAAAILSAADAPAHACGAYLEHAAHRKALIFTPTVELAHAMAATFREAGVAAEGLDGSMPLGERRAMLARLASGETRAVANCAVLTEGFDEPSVDCIIIARPTRSRVLYTQMIGRGTRTFPGKSDCLVMDLVGVTERFDLVTLPRLFGLKPNQLRGDETVREALERDVVERRAVEGERIAEEVELFRRRDRLAWVGYGDRWLLELGKGQLWREPYLSSWRVVFIEARSNERLFVAQDVDLGYAHGIAEDIVRRHNLAPLADANAAWRKKPMSAKQRDFILKLGGEPTPDLSQGEASALISQLKAQRNQRLAPA